MKKFSRIFTVVVALVMIFATAVFAAGCNKQAPEPIATSITLDTANVCMTFDVNERFTSQGLVVTAHFNDDSTKDVTSQSKVSSPNMSEAGTKEVEVTYLELKASYTITVNAVCTHKCPECGYCMDFTSTAECCAVKCGDNRKESYTFQAENSRVVTTSGTLGGVTTFENKEDSSTGEPVSGRGNFSANTGASLTFNIYSPADTTVTMLARISRGVNGVTVFTDVALPIITAPDGEVQILDRSTKVERTNSGAWFDFQEVNIGCIQLKEGVNAVRLAPTGTAYNFDYLAFLSDEVLTWEDGTAADIIGVPRFGLSPEDEAAEDVTLENIAISDGGNIITATVACTTDITKASSVTLNKIPAEAQITFDEANSRYNVTINAEGMGLVENTTYTVRFMGEGKDVLAIGELAYIASANINDGTDDSTWTKSEEFRAYSAPSSEVLNPAVRISSKLKATTSRANDDGYYPVGNLDMNKGQWVSFYINSSEAATVGLYMELGQLTTRNTFRDWVDLEVNGVAYNSDAAMPTGANYIASNTYTLIGFIPLAEGNNEIRFTVNSTAATSSRNIYGLQFTSQTATLSWGEAPEIVLESVSVSAKSTARTEYYAGETFEAENLVLDLSWSDGNVTQVKEGFTVTPSGALTVEDTVVTVSYTDGDVTKEIEIEITVTEPAARLKEVVLSESSVYEDEYFSGQTFDASGITLIARFTDDSTQEITAEQFTVTPSGALTPEDKVVVLSYTYAGDTRSVEIPVTVTEHDLTGISLNKDSTVKTEYTAGQSFDASGLVLDATFSDGSVLQVTAGFTVTPGGALNVNVKAVIVSYTFNGIEKTIEIPVTVNPTENGLDYIYNATTAPGSTELNSGISTEPGSAGNTNIAANRPDADGYYPIGNINSNTGVKITFTVTVEKDVTVGLYAEFSNRNSDYVFSDSFALSVNGTAVESDASMPHGDSFTPSNSYVYIGEINLKAGENTITFTTVAFDAYNIYGIAFDSSEEISW